MASKRLQLYLKIYAEIKKAYKILKIAGLSFFNF